MRKTARKIIALDAARSKQLLKHSETRNQRAIKITKDFRTGRNIHSHELNCSFKRKKRAAQLLHNLSNGKLVIVDNYYNGHHARHRIKSLASSCGHQFKASLDEVRTYGPKQICPFCNTPDVMERFGSVEAIQEHVLDLSLTKTYFLGDNTLNKSSKSTDIFSFQCLIHNLTYEITMVDFLKNAGRSDGCPICIREYSQFP